MGIFFGSDWDMFKSFLWETVEEFHVLKFALRFILFYSSCKWLVNVTRTWLFSLYVRDFEYVSSIFSAVTISFNNIFTKKELSVLFENT